MLVSTSKVLLVRAPENEDCCITSSILTSEDGKYARWPLVSLKYGGCRGGTRRTFQQWLDFAVKEGDGFCFDKWLFIRKGTLFKTIIS